VRTANVAAPHPLPSPQAGKANAPTSSQPKGLLKRVVPKADGRYLIYFEPGK